MRIEKDSEGCAVLEIMSWLGGKFAEVWWPVWVVTVRSFLLLQ